MTNDKTLELITESIKEAEKSRQEDKGVHPKVGVILADQDGNILERAHRGESGDGDHAEFLCIMKAKEKNVNLGTCLLFVTLEPCTARGPGKTACTKHIIDSGIKKVYIGMLDPNPQICGKGETRLRYHLDVERYPGEQVNKILEMNKNFVEMHRKVHLSSESLYIRAKINGMMTENLRRKGIVLQEELPIATNLTLTDIKAICKTCEHKNKGTKDDLEKIIREARAEAFDKKYADRGYDNDSRGLGDHWTKAVRYIMSSFGASDYPKRRVLVVGIGNGLEGEELYATCTNLTAVDIGRKSLEKAKKILPNANFIIADAEDLKKTSDGSEDIYICLRTYQSTYFDRDAALREAYRVVRQGGVVLISIANGFLEQGAIIPGLLIPGTSFVDPNLGFQIADQIRNKMSVLRFEEIGLHTTFDEIFVYGRRGR